MGIELDHPVANDLERHPANLRRFGARRAFVNRRQRQKPARLRPILRSPGRRPYHLCIKVSPKRNGHGEPPEFAPFNQTPADSGTVVRVSPSGIWYNLNVAAKIRDYAIDTFRNLVVHKVSLQCIK